jgi:hypothetical protein
MGCLLCSLKMEFLVNFYACFGACILICSTSPVELQKMINVIVEHCRDWRYSIAKEKTKILSVGVKFRSCHFFLGGSDIEEVKSYRYLGGILHRSLSDAHHFRELLSKMSSSVQSTLCLGARSYSLKTCCLLFESLVASSGIYGSQVFIPSRSMCTRFDVCMKRYFKRGLGLAVSTHSAVFYGELLALTFSHRFAICALQYLWHLLHSDPSSVVAQVYAYFSLVPRRNLSSVYRGRVSFMEYIHNKLDLYGVSLDVASGLSKDAWTRLIRKRVNLKASQDWEVGKSFSSLLSEYSLLKAIPNQDFIFDLEDTYVARLIFKLRVGSNALYCSLQRYEGIPREDRLCPLCSLECEDSLHFCSKCP